MHYCQPHSYAAFPIECHIVFCSYYKYTLQLSSCPSPSSSPLSLSSSPTMIIIMIMIIIVVVVIVIVITIITEKQTHVISCNCFKNNEASWIFKSVQNLRRSRSRIHDPGSEELPDQNRSLSIGGWKSSGKCNHMELRGASLFSPRALTHLCLASPNGDSRF